MRVIPAIDLSAGRCVRLVEGRPGTGSTYSDDPAAQARAFVEAGATRIHVVDLDGAFKGVPENQAAIRAIVAAVAGRAEIEVGGGLRGEEDVARVLALGASFAILGTMLVKAPDRFRALCAAHPGRIVAGIDARDGRVATDGWLEATSVDAGELASRAASYGACAIIHTDISRDGTGRGVNVEATRAIARAAPIPVFASGGVDSLDDLRAIAATEIAGVVVGRALYEGRFGLRDALGI